MKITKKQLRRIIREEKARLLRESSWDRYGDVPDAMPDPMEEFRSRGDIEKYTQNLEKIIEFGGMDFSDEEIKAAIADAMARLGIK